jgi:hypothetical protein
MALAVLVDNFAMLTTGGAALYSILSLIVDESIPPVGSYILFPSVNEISNTSGMSDETSNKAIGGVLLDGFLY